MFSSSFLTLRAPKHNPACPPPPSRPTPWVEQRGGGYTLDYHLIEKYYLSLMNPAVFQRTFMFTAAQREGSATANWQDWVTRGRTFLLEGKTKGFPIWAVFSGRWEISECHALDDAASVCPDWRCCTLEPLQPPDIRFNFLFLRVCGWCTARYHVGKNQCSALLALITAICSLQPSLWGAELRNGKE